MTGIDQAEVTRMLNASCSATAYTTKTTGFKVKLNSTASTASTQGTELPSGGGYVTGGQTSTAPFASTSAAGSAVLIPHTAILTWTNASGSPWSIVSFDLLDGAGVRTWFGNFTGQPIAIAIGNTFQLAIDSISIALA